MFNFDKTLKTPTDLQKEIDRLMAELANEKPDTDEYAKIVDQLSKLYKLKETDSKQRVSRDTLAVILGNLTGILLIINHERINVISSKAFGLVKSVK